VKKTTAAVLAFLLAAAAAAAPPDVQETLDVKVGSLNRFVVKAEKGKKVAFAPAFKDADCFVERLYSDNPDVVRFLVQPQTSGTYVITFWTVGEGDYKQITIKAGGPAPVPPGPVPPADPFVAAIKAAIGREAADVRPLAPRLADVYEFGADRAAAKSGDGQAYLADTWGALFEAMAGKAGEVGVAGKLPAVNAAVAPEVKRLFPVKDTDPISTTDRGRAGTEFRRVAAAIREAGK